eukprot:CAMPEP_0195264520 /NCGR_PEP_ID=MMETSP0706-20130129/10905_1 /TAXON_ID=33640 /ORGANISM="Asterionellopsis glacialis, Strain CCMP134" /LENGTH=242 /DNA_ID=CAMNT_0040318819 /DNA_START=74 /DNA_END=802 /DNA_ORIENTATION=-
MSHELQFSVEGGSPEKGNFAGPMTGGAVPGAAPASGAPSGLSSSAHPIVCIFHLLFKGGALFLYLFGDSFTGKSQDSVSGANFITVTVICILLLAADFWVVKNITGRLLVGLRWWNKVEGETTRWIYESAGDAQVYNKFDKSVFWWGLYATPFVWFWFFFIGVITLHFKWLIITMMALGLSTANVYGYYKCSSDQKAKFQQMMQQGAQAGAMGLIRSGFMNMILGAATPAPQAQPNQGATYA